VRHDEINWNLHFNPPARRTTKFRLFLRFPSSSFFDTVAKKRLMMNTKQNVFEPSMFNILLLCIDHIMKLNPMWKTANNNFKSFEVECFSKHRKKKAIEQSIDLFWILSECHQRLMQRKSQIHTEKKEKLSKMEMREERKMLFLGQWVWFIFRVNS
jgi:hypothetical protein